jgi:hypothetical protein
MVDGRAVVQPPGAVDTRRLPRSSEWWDANVGMRQTAHSKINAELRSPMSMAKAEKLSGISQQKVSRWNGRLVDAPLRCAVALLVRLSRVAARMGATGPRCARWARRGRRAA